MQWRGSSHHKFFILLVNQYTIMAKSKKDNGYSLFPGGLSPKGFIAKKATGDGRNTNPTKNIKRKYG